MNPALFYRIAACLALIGLLAHEFVGAPMVLPPLAATDLPPNVVWLHHFSWHVGSVAVLAMVGMFAYAAQRPGNIALAVTATTMSAGFTGLAFWLAIFGDGVMWSTPAPYVWLVIAIIGAVGVASDARSGHTP